MYHKMRLKELNKLCKVIDWVAYFRDAFKQVGKEIDENEYIIIYSPDYMSNLSKLIQRHLENENDKM